MFGRSLGISTPRLKKRVRIMKLILTSALVLLTALFACCQERDLKIVWDQYDTQEQVDLVEFFVAYKWQGNDSATFSYESMVVVDTVVQDPLTQEFIVITPFTDGKTIRGACVAFDSLGRGSEWALTAFYVPPDIPEKIRIVK